MTEKNYPETAYEQLQAASHDHSEQPHLVQLWNEYSDAETLDDRIYPMDDLSDVLEGMKPTDIVNKVYYGKLNPNQEWFRFDGGENLESTMFPADWMCLRNMAEFAVDHPDIAEECGLRMDYLETYVTDQIEAMPDDRRADLVTQYRQATGDNEPDVDLDDVADWVKDHDDVALTFEIETDAHAETMTPPLALAARRSGQDESELREAVKTETLAVKRDEPSVSIHR